MATATSNSSILRNGAPVVATIPAVPGYPVIGNLLAFRRDKLGLQDEAARIGPIARFSIFHIPVYVITDADLAHQVLVDSDATFIKSAGLQFLRPLLGDGLLTAEGATHKRHRKLLAPAFAPKRLAAYGEGMVAETEAQVRSWGGAPGKQVDLANEMMELTLTIAGKTLFGADVRKDARQIAQGLDLAMHALQANLTSALQLGYDWPLPRHLQMKRAVKLIDEVVFRLIREGRARGEDRGDVLSLLLLARDEGVGLTDAEVRDEVMTLLLAGHETTANVLSWTWYELGKNPEALARLIEEVRVQCGARPVTDADLPAMPWNLAVLEEAMRMHPPAYMTGREAQREIVIGGHTLPPHSIVAINIRGIHRRADYYPAPLAFRPERMLADAKKARPRQYYLPFGAGPRVCIGSHFALLEAQLLLATMVQRASIRTLVSHVAPEPLVTLRPKGGIPAHVYAR